MVLINDRPICTACGTPGQAGANTDRHEECHPHYDEQHKPGPDEITRLRILLPHWLEHNEEHLQDLRGWTAKARALGQRNAGDLMEEAIEHMEACNKALLRALEMLAM